VDGAGDAHEAHRCGERSRCRDARAKLEEDVVAWVRVGDLADFAGLQVAVVLSCEDPKEAKELGVKDTVGGGNQGERFLGSGEGSHIQLCSILTASMQRQQ